MRYGVQLFGPNPLFLQAPEVFLAHLRQAGYRYLEPCLALGPCPGVEDRVWSLDDLNRFQPLLKQHGFREESCHVFTQDLEKDLPLLIHNDCAASRVFSNGQIVYEQFLNLCTADVLAQPGQPGSQRAFAHHAYTASDDGCRRQP